ncbi:MAG: hypothetical protein NC417_14605 [Candidatus Gastranaerophilales bacterium]|nr:hypothetical protein [Candidatus Gastranaerophilales bacterium]
MKNIRRLIIICIITLCVCVFPASLVRKEKNIDFAMDGNYYEVTDYDTQIFEQTFVAQTSYIDEIAFDVGLPKNDWGGAETLYVCMKEENSQKLLMETQISVQDINDEAYTYVPISK